MANVTPYKPLDNEQARKVWNNLPEEAIKDYCERIARIQTRSGITINRRNSPINDFYMYLLGTQENFTVDDLVHLEERHKDDIPRLFDQFINDYEKLTTLPVADPPAKSATESAQFIGGIMRRGMEKISDYRLPDFDLNKVSALKDPEFAGPLDIITNICIDSSQDHEVYTKINGDPFQAQRYSAYMDGFGGMDTFERMQERISCYGQGFSTMVSSLNKPLNDIQRANIFYLVKTTWDNDFRGKAIGDITGPGMMGLMGAEQGVRDVNVEHRSGEVMGAINGSRRISPQSVGTGNAPSRAESSKGLPGAEARDFLLGDSETLSWQKQLNDALLEHRRNQGVSSADVRAVHTEELSVKAFEAYNAGNVDMNRIAGTDDKSQLTADQKNGLDMIWGTTFGVTAHANYLAYAMTGGTFFDAVFIDGQSASSLFGEKYSELSGHALEQAYQAEILSACFDPGRKVELAGVNFSDDMTSASITDERTRISFAQAEYKLLSGFNDQDKNIDLTAFGEQFIADPAAAAKLPEFASVRRGWNATSSLLKNDRDFLASKHKGTDLFDCFRINGETVNAYYDRVLKDKFPDAKPYDEISIKAAALYSARTVPGYRVSYQSPKRSLNNTLSFTDPAPVTFDADFTRVNRETRDKLRELDGLMDKHPYDMTVTERRLFRERFDEFTAGKNEAETGKLKDRLELLDNFEHPKPPKQSFDDLAEKPELSAAFRERLSQIRKDEDLIIDVAVKMSKDEGATRPENYFGCDHRDFCRMIEFPQDMTDDADKKAYTQAWLTRYMVLPEGRKQCLDEYFDRIDRRDNKDYDLSCLTIKGDKGKPGPDGLTPSEHDLEELLRLYGSTQTRSVKGEVENPDYFKARYKSERAQNLFDAAAERDINGIGSYLMSAMGANGLSASTLSPSGAAPYRPDTKYEAKANAALYERRKAALLGEKTDSAVEKKLDTSTHIVRGQEVYNRWLRAMDIVVAGASPDKTLDQNEIKLLNDAYYNSAGVFAGLSDPMTEHSEKKYGIDELDRLFVDGKPLKEYVGKKYGDIASADSAARNRIENAMKAEFMAAAMSGKHRTEVGEIHIGPDDKPVMGIVEYRLDSHVLDGAEKRRTSSGMRRAFDFGATKIETRADLQDKLWKNDPDKERRHEDIKARLAHKMMVMTAERDAAAKREAEAAKKKTEAPAQETAPVTDEKKTEVTKKGTRISADDLMLKAVEANEMQKNEVKTRKRRHSMAVTSGELAAAAQSEPLKVQGP